LRLIGVAFLLLAVHVLIQSIVALLTVTIVVARARVGNGVRVSTADYSPVGSFVVVVVAGAASGVSVVVLAAR
jgi:hypothetical protein